MIKAVGDTPITHAISRPEKVGPEHNPWFWNPYNPSVRFAEGDFARKLREFDPELRVTWNPIREHWTLWAPKPTLQHPICHGWMLLFHIGPRELDERVFARLYAASQMKWGDGKRYFAAVEREMEREAEKARQQTTQDNIDMAMETFDHSQIKVAMRGKSSGSKFSTYHA